MSDAKGFDVQSQKIDDGFILRPSGEIDLSRAPSLRVRLTQAQKARPARLVIDLQGVPYMDSSGVATLVEAMQVSRRYGGKVILCSLQDKVRSIFEIARLDMVFTIVDDTEKALTA